MPNTAPSLDPRVNRVKLPEAETFTPLEELDQWQTWEVFHQAARGEQHQHVGIVHAPNAEVALLMAKEQYARRFKCVNIWVVRTADIAATDYDDADMFEPSFDKSYREAHGYKNTRSLIVKYKQAKGQTANAEEGDEIAEHTRRVEQTIARHQQGAEDKPKRAGVVIGKKR